MADQYVTLIYVLAAGCLIMGFFLLLQIFVARRVKRKYHKTLTANLVLREQLESINKISEKKVKERTIDLENSLKLVTYQATHDLLTDLPNQRSMLSYLEKAIMTARKDGSKFAVIFFSINELQKINDGLGYQVGDYLIRIVSQRFQQAFSVATKDVVPATRYKVTITRKDVFIILLDPLISVDEIENSNIFFALLEDPVDAIDHQIKLTASIGVCVYPQDGKDTITLLMNADSAMQKAKEFGGNHLTVYESEKNNSNISIELEKERYLHNAVRNNEFLLQYQPIISAKTGMICGAEALVRWNSPVLGSVSPDNFISLAEANGIIIPLGEWVLRTTCMQAKLWCDSGYPIKIAVNMSAKQLLRNNIVELIDEVLKTSGLNPEYLELELTESEAFDQEIIPVLSKLKQMGLTISIDDFGTGYSNLTKLKLLNFDILKIDKSFVRDLESNADTQAIVVNTISLAKKMKGSVIAEGVETVGQLEFLATHHCDMFQGYYFSPPVYADGLSKLLELKKIFLI
jgi:diguanylate cyclase (GGDEF)-like protein